MEGREMLQRVLIASVFLALAGGLTGCGKKKREAPEARKSTEPQRDGKPLSWQPGAGVRPTGAGRTELERIAVHCLQLEKLATRKRLPLDSIESIAWTINRRASGLVAAYDCANRGKATADLAAEKRVKADEWPDVRWASWPEAVRDLDRVAINARYLARAAARLNLNEVRQRLANLKTVAWRCLPRPTPLPEVAGVSPAGPAGASSADAGSGGSGELEGKAPEAGRTAAEKPESGKPETTEPHTPKPEAPKTDTTKPDAGKPDESDTGEGDAKAPATPGK
jgi:hypothetical protein